MSHVPLSNTGSWKLSFKDQDVRGYKALDADGNHVGRVDRMIVDTNEKRVDTIVLEDGTEYPARDISIGDGVVYLTTITEGDLAESVTVYDDYGHVVERESVKATPYTEYRDDFRSHYTKTYGGSDYDTYEPAYRYGYESAYEDSYRDRHYTDAESDLRTGYSSRYPDRDYDTDRDAVRYGYTRARGDYS